MFLNDPHEGWTIYMLKSGNNVTSQQCFQSTREITANSLRTTFQFLLLSSSLAKAARSFRGYSLAILMAFIRVKEDIAPWFTHVFFKDLHLPLFPHDRSRLSLRRSSLWLISLHIVFCLIQMIILVHCYFNLFFNKSTWYNWRNANGGKDMF